MPPSISGSRLKAIEMEEKKQRDNRKSVFLDNSPVVGKKSSAIAKKPLVKSHPRSHSVAVPPKPVIQSRSPATSAPNSAKSSPKMRNQTVVLPEVESRKWADAKSPMVDKVVGRPHAELSSVSTPKHNINTPTREVHTPSNDSLLDELQTQLVHFLACAPREVEECIGKTKASREKVVEILKKVFCSLLTLFRLGLLKHPIQTVIN
jgi:hypothetical protein